MMESVRHHLTEAGILITTPASHTPVNNYTVDKEGEHHHIFVSVHLELWKVRVMLQPRVHGQDSTQYRNCSFHCRTGGEI